MAPTNQRPLSDRPDYEMKTTILTIFGDYFCTSLELSTFLIGKKWARSTKNPDVSTGPLARPFALSLIHSFAHLLTQLAYSLVRKWMIRWLIFFFFFYSGL